MKIAPAFREISSSNQDEPSLESLKDSILAYYPEYYIVHFKAHTISDSLYSVKIGSTDKLIGKAKFMEFLTWPDYITRHFSTTTPENSLRIEPSESSNIITGVNYDELNFRNVEVSEDWVKVICNKDCEGCPEDREITGW